MADAVVQVAPDSTGKMVDNSSLTVGSNTVYRQRLNISDPTTAAGIATVTVSPGANDYGLTVRNVNSDLVIAGTISVTDAAVAAPAGAGAFVSGTSTTGSYLVTTALGQGDSGFNIQVTGLTSGTLYVEASLDSTTGIDGNWMAITSRQLGLLNTNVVLSITANGMYRGSSGGYKYLRVRSSGTLSGTPAVIIRVGDGVAPVFLETAIPTGTNTLGNIKITDGVTTGAMRPDSVFRVAMDATSLLLDTFETLNTTDTWTLGGTVVPTQTAGNLSVNAGTAASASSTIRSQFAFTNGATAFTYFTSAWVIDAAAVTGNKRVWGLGIPNATPTVSVPITNGVVYEVQDTDGSMVGAVYSNSVRTQTITIPRPTDGGAHRYAIFFRASRVYFELDSSPITTYSLPLPNPVVDALPAVAVSVNAASGNPATAATLACSVVGVADTGRNNQQISDGTFAWRKATVKAGSASPLITDPALVVSISPNCTITTQGAVLSPVTASITTATTVIGPVNVASANLITVASSGTYAGVSFVFEASPDGTNYFTVQGSRVDNALLSNGITLGSSASLAWDIPCGGWTTFRVRATAWTSGSCLVTIAPQASAYDPAPSAVSQGVVQTGASLTGIAPVLIGGASAGGAGAAQMSTIKAPSTAALSTDSSLVVAVNPNTAVNIAGAPGTSATASLTAAVASGTGTASTTAMCVAYVGTSGNATITLKGTFSGTFFFEASDDSGTTWYMIIASPMSGGAASSTTGALTVATAYNVSCPGITHLRVRCGTFVSGSATVNIYPGGFLYAPVTNSVIQSTDTVTTGSLSTTDTVVSAPGPYGTPYSGTPVANSYVVVPVTPGYSTFTVTLSNYTQSGSTVYFEQSFDSTTGIDGNWLALPVHVVGQSTYTSSSANTYYYATNNGTSRGSMAGCKYIRVRQGAGTASTTVIAVTVRQSLAPSTFYQEIGPIIGQGAQASATTSAWYTRDVKDTARTNFNIYAEAVAGVTTEALVSLSYSSGFAAPTTGATSITVPTGKTLRIVSITVGFVSTTTTSNNTRVRMRVNTAGAAVIGSPLIWTMRFGWDAATVVANQMDTFSVPLPDGMEIPAGAGIAFSHVEAAANGTVDISVDGFLY